ncbi:MAG: hypothetical protein IKZ71_06505 [Bacteroidales bacterium]|nr:hypothetical protein [Bacteroidales bacterium]
MGDASTSIRLNPFKGCDGPEGTPVPWSPYGRILAQRPNFTLDPLFHAGCYYVQDSSAMFVGHLFRKYLLAGSGLRVLDLCAAPGGKTTDLAASLREALGDKFELTANEVMKARVSVLADNVGVWGDPNVTVTSADPAVIGRLMKGYYDVIVADVPCSGEGMFRKDPRAVAEWTPELPGICAARQRRILADVWPALKEGGLLIYSTCTYEDCENDSNLEWAARELGGDIIPPEDEFPQYGVRLTRCGSLLKAGEVPGEGQWAGALRKTSSAPSARCKVADLRPLESRLQIFDEIIPRVELDLQQALRYLHRDSLFLPQAPLGMLVVCYRQHPLGFAKNLGTRCNNLYPKSRRIQMDV